LLRMRLNHVSFSVFSNAASSYLDGGFLRFCAVLSNICNSVSVIPCAVRGGGAMVGTTYPVGKADKSPNCSGRNSTTASTGFSFLVGTANNCTALSPCGLGCIVAILAFFFLTLLLTMLLASFSFHALQALSLLLASSEYAVQL